jgi:hypothetical protein
MMRLAILLALLGCYDSDGDVDDAGCTADSCAAECGAVGGACISAPPDDRTYCVCL